MSTAHQEAVAMAVYTAVLGLLLLNVWRKRDNPQVSRQWLYVLPAGMLLGLVLMVITASGTALTGW